MPRNRNSMKTIRILSLVAIAAALTACSSGVDMPKGSSKGYTSARLVAAKANSPASSANERKIHGMIKNSIAAQFKSAGMAYNQGAADLVVSYLVIYQDNAMTTYYDEYFGYSSNPEEISDVAHQRGVIESKRPDRFERAGLVVDVIDARTYKLVYRNFATGDIVRGVSDATRAQRVNQAVNTALGPFFR